VKDYTVKYNKAFSTAKIGIMVILILVLFESSIIVETSPSIGQQKFRPCNIILMIGDGMGTGHITATRISINPDKLLNMDQLSYGGLIMTHSLDNLVTDSAAAATALATGFKTNNDMISMDPDERILETVLEFAQTNGMSTGLITTTRITHATPAAFAAHVPDREMEDKIAEQLIESEVDVLLGGGRRYFLPESHSNSVRRDDKNLLEKAETLNYTYVNKHEELLNIRSRKVLGIFDDTHMRLDQERESRQPSLAEMTQVAIQILSNNPQGFFLMVEGGRIDHASHSNDLGDVIGEMLAFDLAIGVALNFTRSETAKLSTLLIVTSDHETGGLSIDDSSKNEDMEIIWCSDEHTGNMVPIFSEGLDASLFTGVLDNTDVVKFIFQVMRTQREVIPQQQPLQQNNLMNEVINIFKRLQNILPFL